MLVISEKRKYQYGNQGPSKEVGCVNPLGCPLQREQGPHTELKPKTERPLRMTSRPSPSIRVGPCTPAPVDSSGLAPEAAAPGAGPLAGAPKGVMAAAAMPDT